jgi:hypothetical protein
MTGTFIFFFGSDVQTREKRKKRSAEIRNPW